MRPANLYSEAEHQRWAVIRLAIAEVQPGRMHLASISMDGIASY
jgi:hypothetical protein